MSWFGRVGWVDLIAVSWFERVGWVDLIVMSWFERVGWVDLVVGSMRIELHILLRLFLLLHCVY